MSSTQKSNKLKKPFIYYKDLSLFDKWSIGIYFFATIAVLLSYHWITEKHANMMVMGYALTLQLGGYLFLYRSLRNFRCYLFWFGFSIVHLIMYFGMKNDPTLLMARGSSADLLRNTFILLLFFQLLRYVSLKTQRQELVMVSRGSNIDDYDHRKITIIDNALFFAYFAAFCALGYLTFPH